MKRVVFVVDDDAAVRASLRLLLEGEGHEVHDYCSAEDFLARCPDDACGCIITDLRMPGRSGLELQEALATQHVQLPLIVLTAHADVPSAVRSMKNGAVDFLQKPYSPEQLLDLVASAVAQAAREHDARRHSQDLSTRAASLTPREREVMERVARGESNKVIAIDLGISERTVELHRGRGMKKMEVRSVAELVRCFTAIEPT